jgi:hypothetical protein
MLTGYEICKDFMAVKLHFKDKFDYFKYNGKYHLKFKTYEAKHDKFHYEKLANKHYCSNNAPIFFCANYIEDEKSLDYIGNVSEQNYNNWFRRIQSLTYRFNQDIIKLDDNFDSEFKIIDGQLPSIIQKFLEKEITLETIVIINRCIRFIEKTENKIEKNIFNNYILNKIKKYSPFLEFDTKKYTQLILKRYENTKI